MRQTTPRTATTLAGPPQPPSKRRRRRRAVGALALVFALGVALPANAEARPDWSALLRQSGEWFASPAGREAVAHVLSHQTDLGDWPKNTDTVARAFTGERSRLTGTFDNGATVNELRFLARAHRFTGDPACAAAVRRGIHHILAAQYPNGGWPQRHPPGPGYARYITFNDGVMVNLLELLRAAARDEEFALLDPSLRRRAGAAFERGLDCVLRCQVRVNGRLTVWAAQHDEVTLEPRPARAFEPAALSAGESAGVLRLLMSLPDPSPAVRTAIRAGAAWFEATRLTGFRVVTRDGDRWIEPDPHAPPLWARFYEIGTDRPVFAGRDGVVKYALAEIERERRAGYAWYGAWGMEVARAFARWAGEQLPAP